MIIDIYRLLLVLAIYLSASNTINPDSSPIYLLLPLGISVVDAYVLNGKVRIGRGFYILACFAALVSLIDFDLVVLPVSLAVLNISVSSSTAATKSFSRACIASLLLILSAAVLINEPYVARYYSAGQIDIISFLDTSPQQFGTLALTALVGCKWLLEQSSFMSRGYIRLFLVLLQILCTVIQLLIGERLLFIVCIVVLLQGNLAFLKLKSSKLSLGRLALVLLLGSFFGYAIVRIDLNMSIAWERFLWLRDAFRMLSEEGSKVIGSSRFHQVSDYSNLRYIVPYVSYIVNLVPILVPFIILRLWKGVDNSWLAAPKFILIIAALVLVLKNAGRVTDPSVILYIFTIMLSPATRYRPTGDEEVQPGGISQA